MYTGPWGFPESSELSKSHGVRSHPLQTPSFQPWSPLRASIRASTWGCRSKPSKPATLQGTIGQLFTTSVFCGTFTSERCRLCNAIHPSAQHGTAGCVQHLEASRWIKEKQQQPSHVPVSFAAPAEARVGSLCTDVSDA